MDQIQLAHASHVKVSEIAFYLINNLQDIKDARPAEIVMALAAVMELLSQRYGIRADELRLSARKFLTVGRCEIECSLSLHGLHPATDRALQKQVFSSRSSSHALVETTEKVRGDERIVTAEYRRVAGKIRQRRDCRLSSVTPYNFKHRQRRVQ